MEPSSCSYLTRSSKTIGRLIFLWTTLKCPASGLAPLLISAPSRAALSKASFSLSLLLSAWNIWDKLFWTILRFRKQSIYFCGLLSFPIPFQIGEWVSRCLYNIGISQWHVCAIELRISLLLRRIIGIESIGLILFKALDWVPHVLCKLAIL